CLLDVVVKLLKSAILSVLWTAGHMRPAEFREIHLALGGHQALMCLGRAGPRNPTFLGFYVYIERLLQYRAIKSSALCIFCTI
ncbi:MAG: hypothetical protein VW948_09390, partial [Burkholderiaceae bacterium]